MTPRAVRTKLGFVYVRVTRRATFIDCSELQISVAAHTRHRFVLPDEGKAGLGMVEAGVPAHAPRIGRMTSLAGKLDVSVR